MQQVNADEGVYKCEDGEQITITLTPSGPNAVSSAYTFSSEPSKVYQVDDNQIQFKMSGESMRIWVIFSFLSAKASCKVSLSGSKGGDFEDPNDFVNIGNKPKIVDWRFID